MGRTSGQAVLHAALVLGTMAVADGFQFKTNPGGCSSCCGKKGFAYQREKSDT